MTNDNTEEKILKALRQRDNIAMPTSQVAELTATNRRPVLRHLRRLEEEGRVGSVEVGSGGFAWYLQDDLDRLTSRLRDDDNILIPTYHAHVRRPVDGRGRVTIGSEYAKKRLTFAVLDPEIVQVVAPVEWEYDKPLKWQRVVSIDTETADDRGRIHISRKWGGQTVSIAVLEVDD